VDKNIHLKIEKTLLGDLVPLLCIPPRLRRLGLRLRRRHGQGGAGQGNGTGAGAGWSGVGGEGGRGRTAVDIGRALYFIN